MVVCFCCQETLLVLLRGNLQLIQLKAVSSLQRSSHGNRNKQPFSPLKSQKSTVHSTRIFQIGSDSVLNEEFKRYFFHVSRYLHSSSDRSVKYLKWNISIWKFQREIFHALLKYFKKKWKIGFFSIFPNRIYFYQVWHPSWPE
jgi:hypothetical protein